MFLGIQNYDFTQILPEFAQILHKFAQICLKKLLEMRLNLHLLRHHIPIFCVFVTSLSTCL